MAEPTPRPWRLFLQGNNEKIGDHAGRKIAVLCRTADERAANGALIVRAVNAHDDLVAALKEALVQAEGCWRHHYGNNPEGSAEPYHIALMRAALAKAGAP